MKPVKAKETTSHWCSLASVVLAAVLVASGLFTSCAKNEVELPSSDSKQISLCASVGTVGVETQAQSRTQAKARAVDTDALTLYFARADETASGTYGNYATSAISATRLTGSGARQLTFTPTQYYRTDKLKTKLTGWYPGGATTGGETSGKGYYNGSTRTVSWTINGQQDIMTASRVGGSTLSPISSSMTFTHRLAQLCFHPYAEEQSTIDAWGKITKIEVLNQQNTVTYPLANDALGTVSFSNNATNTFSAGIANGGTAMSLLSYTNRLNATQVGNPVMIVPQSSDSYTLKLRITTVNQAAREVTLNQALTAGIRYRLYLRFKGLGITISASPVADWALGGSTNDELGNMRVGDYYFTDGTVSPKLVSGKTANGIVYYIDPNNPLKFKVMALEQGGHMWWAAKTTYVIGSGAQDRANGKGNTAAIKAYFDAHTATVGSSFATAFPAAAHCYNYKGKGGTDAPGTWHLPAKDELQYLWCAYNGADPVRWDSGVSTAVPSNAAKQAVWNSLVTAAGTTIGDNLLWSSNESSDDGANACRISFSVELQYPISGTEYAGKNTKKQVRCVRDIN